jgi:hypothetical protein
MKNENKLPMKKTAIILIALALIAGSCGQATKKQVENNTVVEETQHIINVDSDDSEYDDEYEDKTEIPVLENAHTITIDNAYFETKTGVKKISHYDGEYSKYGIPKLSTLGFSSENFVYDNMSFSFSIVTEVKLYDNIYSLVIRNDTEHALGIWLVNYDKNKTMEGFYEYIDSYAIGQDEWAEGASWIKSVIHLQPEPYIEQESVSWEEKENCKIEILKSGKFKVIQTIHSKYEM